MSINWFNLGVMAVLCVGHAALWIGLINRAHYWPLPYAVLHPLRIAHDLIIVGGPIAFLWFLGYRGPGLLSGGSWLDVPWSLLFYLGLCLIAGGAVPIVGLSRQLRQQPRALVSKTQTTRNLQQELGQRLDGPGPFRWMAALPYNDVFKLEVVELTLRVERLPPAWNGLRILQLSDVHFLGNVALPYFERVFAIARELPADLIVFTGDLLDNERCLPWIENTFAQLSAPLGCYFILGNHDWLCGAMEPTRGELQKAGWQDVGGKTVTIEHAGHPLVIAGNERPWLGVEPDLQTAPPDAFRLLLSHTPDHLYWARRQRYDLVLAGHTHGGQVRLPWFGPVYSPCRYGCEFSAGLFASRDTLMYVSRGISGRHPLRWNCPPEITRITLYGKD